MNCAEINRIIIAFNYENKESNNEQKEIVESNLKILADFATNIFKGWNSSSSIIFKEIENIFNNFSKNF